MTNKLPGIKEIYTVPTSELQNNIVMRALCGVPVSVMCEMHRVDGVRNAECVAKEQWMANSRLENVTLSFEAIERIDTNDGLAWVICDVNEDWWIIGAKEPQYPCATRNYTTGTPTGDKAVYGYEVKWAARVALIPCTATAIRTPNFDA